MRISHFLSKKYFFLKRKKNNLGEGNYSVLRIQPKEAARKYIASGKKMTECGTGRVATLIMPQPVILLSMVIGYTPLNN